MKDIDLYIEKLAKDNELRKSIYQLVQHSINSKKFNFDSKEIKLNISILEKNGVLVKENSKLAISNSALFYAEFFDWFSSKYQFQLSENVCEAFSFIDKIEDELTEDCPATNISHFFKSLKVFVLFLIHKQCETDFSDFIKGLNKESGHILYDFNYAYSKLVLYTDTQINVLYENLKHLITGVTSDAEYNSNLYEITNAIRMYCKEDSIKGQKLLKHSIDQQIIVHNINIPSISGLYEMDRPVFWNKIKDLVKRKELRISVICALYSTPSETDEEAHKYFSLVSSLIDSSEEELFNHPKFYISLINNKSISDITIKESSFLKLKDLIVSPNQKLRNLTLNQLFFVNGYDSNVIELLKILIQDVEFNKEQIHLVANAISSNKDLIGFIELLTIYGEKFKLEFKAKTFSSAIYNFRQATPEKFSQELIKLITHDLGEIRFIGLRMVEYLNSYNGRFIFQTDILKYDALTQYKLWVSVLSEIKEPKDTLPLLFPLLKTEYSFVKEAFICKIEQLAEEYGSSVIEVIETGLDITIIENSNFYDRIKNYCEAFWNKISKKLEIKELNPLYTQSDIYSFHSENYGKSINKSVSEGVEKNSVFLQLARTVILAKSGGWKHEKHDKVEKLGRFAASFQLPRSYYINPESFDLEYKVNFIENWKDKFKLWEAIISS